MSDLEKGTILTLEFFFFFSNSVLILDTPVINFSLHLLINFFLKYCNESRNGLCQSACADHNCGIALCPGNSSGRGF